MSVVQTKKIYITILCVSASYINYVTTVALNKVLSDNTANTQTEVNHSYSPRRSVPRRW